MRLVLVPILMLAACGDDGGVTPPPDCGCADGGDPPDGGGAREVVGSTRILEVASIYDDDGTPRVDRYATAGAQYLVGRQPRWHREVARAGDCVLLRYTPSQCTPECTGGLCVETDVCEPFPDFQSAGPMSITGLRVPLTMTGTDGYYYADVPLPADLFDEGVGVTASLGGAGFPAHTITSGGVMPLTADIPAGEITMFPGTDHVVRWSPADPGTRIRLTLNANNRGHGLPYLGIIECDVADDAGEVTIAAALVDGFPETQAWRICAGTDCPQSTLRRYRRGVTTVGDAEAELIVGSQVNFGVNHAVAP